MFTPSQQFLYPVLEHQKTALLLHLLETSDVVNHLVIYVRTRDEAHRIAAAINKDQHLAETALLNTKESFLKQALQDFQSGETKILITMDAAAREIDIKGIKNIINFDFPETMHDYICRVGKEPLDSPASGYCITLHTSKSNTPLQKLESTLGFTIQKKQAVDFLYESKAPLTKNKPKGKSGKANKKNKRK